MEYAPYSASPSGYVQRESADHEWEPVPEAQAHEVQEMLIAEKLDAARRVRDAGRIGAVITRAPRNAEIADLLGLTADELAENLAKPDSNAGTRRRLDDAEFDALMSEMGLTPQEARDRFAGRQRSG